MTEKLKLHCCIVSFQIPLVLNKDPEQDDLGNPIIGQDGKQKYRCGFRIGGGIDQDNSKSPQGYPDKVNDRIVAEHLGFRCLVRKFSTSRLSG